MSTQIDARTPPVAAFQIVGAMSPDELKAWRVAPVTGQVSAAERGIDRIPFPFGWYAACYSDELALGEVKPLRAFGKDMALWRGEDGQPRMIDAYCKHLGAHMGVGGKVHGNLLECPFHAWRYDGEEGTVKDIPYSKSIPPQVKRKCTRTWPMAEGNGFVWMWYHPEEAAPLWELDVFPEASDPDWTAYDRYEWIVEAPLQFLTENVADLAHFKYVHGTATYPDAEISFDGHRRMGIVKAKLGTPQGEVDGTITNGNNGPGQSYSRFSGISETLLVTGMMPVEHDKLCVRFAFTQPKDQASGPMGSLARALIRDILKQFDQDKVIWDRQRFIEQAPICEGDGPIGDLRRWYYQFYAEWKGATQPPSAEAA
jgi:phenylpropionate dioxygenase-like ring-hydroxylating dioxygenase large terminal subunit